ncbi:MAG: serine/threonine protein kinase, partial [Kiritimatiellia bacterium]
MPRSPADPPGSVTVVGAAGETLNPLDFGHDPGTDEVPALDGYQDLGVIGRGGMAEVRRVRDVSLNRVMAMKIMHPQFIGSADTVARFLEEAQATAQLTHPGIIPVHSRGRLPDGRLYFTMKEVQGRTLREVIDALHESSDHTGWGQTDWGLTFRGLIATFSRVCEAVAYAHARGVIHRDIKPSNVMTGPFGEVHVLDWGLARVSAASPAWTSVTTVRSGSDAQRTAVGAIAGTPLFMPPEQAAGAF